MAIEEGGQLFRPSQNKACALFFKAMKYIPVILLGIVIGWSYYAYIILLCFSVVTSTVERVIYLIGYHISLVALLWSYWQTMFTASGKVPPEFRLPRSELEKLKSAESEQAQQQILNRFAETLPVSNLSPTGAVRFCEKCRVIKPDRAHHCTACGTCVLKMDHHCPWVNNCVSFTNYKFFILFLAYAVIYCLFITLTTLQYFIQLWKGEIEGTGRINLIFLFLAAAMFALSLMSIFCYHCYLIVRNRTTLEAFRAPRFSTGADKNGFSLGAYNNFQEVFGDNKRTWFLPVFTSMGDGITYPVRTQLQANYNSMGCTENSLGDGINFPQRAVDEDCNHLLSSNHLWAEEAELESPPYSYANRGMLLDLAAV